MSLVKRGKISYCCTPNAMITLKEYLEDYASATTREKGEALVRRELERLPDDRIRNLVSKRLTDIAGGARDFRF